MARISKAHFFRRVASPAFLFHRPSPLSPITDAKHSLALPETTPPESMAEAPTDLAPILEAASDFASYPGTRCPSLFFPCVIIYAWTRYSYHSIAGLQNDASAKEFLDRFPLPLLFRFISFSMYLFGNQLLHFIWFWVVSFSALVVYCKPRLMYPELKVL